MSTPKHKMDMILTEATLPDLEERLALIDTGCANCGGLPEDSLSARIGDIELKLAIADALAAARAEALLRAEMRLIDRDARIAELEAALRECLPKAEFYMKMIAAQAGHHDECTCERCIGMQVKFTKFKRVLEAK